MLIERSQRFASICDTVLTELPTNRPGGEGGDGGSADESGGDGNNVNGSMIGSSSSTGVCSDSGSDGGPASSTSSRVVSTTHTIADYLDTAIDAETEQKLIISTDILEKAWAAKVGGSFTWCSTSDAPFQGRTHLTFPSFPLFFVGNTQPRKLT
jgi:hypothetical protein